MPIFGETSLEELHDHTGKLLYYGIGAFIVGVILLFYISPGTTDFIGALGSAILVGGIGIAAEGFVLKQILKPGMFLGPGEEGFAPVLAKWITEKIANPHLYIGLAIIVIGIILTIAYFVTRKGKPTVSGGVKPSEPPSTV
jgi:uncharacterized membrane protein HdeD (DUF308 family)